MNGVSAHRPGRALPGAALLLCLGLALGAPAQSRAGEAGVPRVAIDTAALARMERALDRYRSLARAGGWPAVAPGPALRQGEEDARVESLRARLRLTGDLGGGAAGTAAFTPRLAAAVRRFQARHGLAVDAIVGPETLAALNVTARERAEILALNLARLRALAPRIPARAVIVNVPSATLALRSAAGPVLDSRVIVGRPSWPTPVLGSAITHISLNPHWYIPKRIAAEEVVPKAREDGSYLERNAIEVYGGVPGTVAAIEHGLVDWARFSELGYRLRQRPGEANPLGKLRFYFANPYDVFLHDTPAKALFARSWRALSHGCVRVEEAFSLAVQLLADNPVWNAERLGEAIATGKSSQITLERPMPLFITYLTAWVDEGGRVQFRRDVYRRDAAELARTASRPCGPPGPDLLPGAQGDTG